MDLLKPAYNIELTAGSRLGSFHDEETKAKMRAAHIGREQPNFWQSTPPLFIFFEGRRDPPLAPSVFILISAVLLFWQFFIAAYLR